MGNINSSNARTDIETNILQQANNTCGASYVDALNNDVLIAASDININQTISGNFVCTIANTFDATITNTITDSIKLSATTENGLLLPSFGSNSNYSNINENVQNSITQILNNTCTVAKSISQNGDFEFSLGGGININQDLQIGNGNGNPDTCNIQNMITASASTAVSNTVAETAAITNAITTIVIVLAVCGTITAVGTQAFKKQDGIKVSEIGNVLKSLK